MSKPVVLISVLNYNNYKSTKECVTSLLKFHFTGSEILIIDNNSPDNSFLDLKRDFPKLKIHKSKFNGGYASGHKISVDYAIKNGFEFIWILNNDLTVRKNTLQELIIAYKTHGIGLYGSITLKSEDPDIVNFGGGITDDISKPLNYNDFEGYSLEEYNQETEFRKVQSIEGSSFLIPIEIIKKYGFIKEDFFMYGEDLDYSYSLKRQWNINSFIVPKSVVVHKGGNSLKHIKFLEEYYRRRNFLYFHRTHYNKSIIKYILKKIGIINFLKFLALYVIGTKQQNYYFNLGVLHSLLNIKGKLND